MAYIHHAVLEFAMQFQCPFCGFTAPVVVKGRGMLSGPVPTEGMSMRAYNSALKNAQMRCEVYPCMRCGKRQYGMFVRAVLETVFMLGLAPVVCVALYWVMDRWHFEDQLATNLTIFGVFAAGLQLAGALGMAYELWSAKGAVRFS